MNADEVKLRFNVLGWIYNPLKSFFLGKGPEEIIVEAVKQLPTVKKILVVGGGADNTIVELLSLKKTEQIILVDISDVLLKKAQSRIVESPYDITNVSFELTPFLKYWSTQKFDVIIFPFYLDLFSDEEIMENIKKAKRMLSSKGQMMIVDFSNSEKLNVWNRSKVFLLYVLFYPISGNIRKSIPPYSVLMSAYGVKKKTCGYSSNNLYQWLLFE